MGEQEGSCIAIIRVSHEASRALLEAIEPDNIQAPSWLSIDCKAVGSTLECRVEVDCGNPQRVLSLRNTLDDLLKAIKAAMEAIEGSMKR